MHFDRTVHPLHQQMHLLQIQFYVAPTCFSIISTILSELYIKISAYWNIMDYKSNVKYSILWSKQYFKSMIY